ncbi:MAG: SUMF1/EgtB/PvdO family nonheme iron enzyme [Anaerolineae bacterium]|nr:SUMF1/EgtB/PvdO family nonheme iron enzyme [Anaerolineae bacterium]
MRLFISYSRDDKQYVHELSEALREETGHDVWIDRRLVGAERWWDTILDQIELCDCFIVILTPRCVSSIFCEGELNYALDLNKPILPLLMKPCDIPERLKAIQYIDLNDLSLEKTLVRCMNALSRIEVRLVKGDFSPSDPLPERPPMPILKAGEPSEHVSEVFAAAEEAAAADNTMLAENLYRQVILVDPDGMGRAATERLAELRWERGREISYANITRLAGNPDTFKGAKAAWRAYMQRYGTGYDPNGYHALLADDLGQPWLEGALTNSQRIHITTVKQQVLIAVMTDPSRSPAERAEAGRKLAELGDPRTGVGLRDDSLPDIAWCEVPAGTFIYRDGERLSLPVFYIGMYPVTVTQFQAFVDAPDGFHNRKWWQGLAKREAEPGEPAFKYGNHPRANVNWYDAVAFCRWLSTRLAFQIRLPTAQEWEKAARGTDGRVYPWGNAYITDYANVSGRQNGLAEPYQQGRTTAVGMYAQGVSPYGALDMSGNVWEWTLTEVEGDCPPNVAGQRVVCGGSWRDDQHYAGMGFARSFEPGVRSDSIGFRVVSTAPIR